VIYTAPGHSYLVCPHLLELDPRLGEHQSRWPPCRIGNFCLVEHEHETVPPDAGGHRVVDFYWWPGCDSIEDHFNCSGSCHDRLRCACGQQLVHADLDDPHNPALRKVGPELTHSAGL